MSNGRKAELGNLLTDTCDAFYWAGFLMADGTTTKSRISLVLAKKDYGHLRKFGMFIEYRGKYTPQVVKGYKSFKMASMDTFTVPNIREKFGFRSRKTENPPNSLPQGTGEQKLAFIVGFIDGDGSIRIGKGRRFCNIGVKVHGSWLGMLRKMAGFVYHMAGCESGFPKLNKEGYAEWTISNSIITKFLKRKVYELKLPVLKRKWQKIDTAIVGLQEMSLGRISQIQGMAKEGLYQSQIARRLKITDAAVLALASRNGITIQKCGYPRHPQRGGDVNVRW